MVGVQTLARPAFRITVHSRLSDAARFHAAMQKELGRSETATLIESIMENLRIRHRERYP